MVRCRSAVPASRLAVQQRVDPFGVVGCDRGAAVQPPGAFGRFVLEQVSTIGFLADDLAGTGAPEPLRGPAMSLGLGHVSSTSSGLCCFLTFFLFWSVRCSVGVVGRVRLGCRRGLVSLRM